MVAHSAINHAGVTGVGLTLLETQTASASATLDFTTFISSTYDEYQIEGLNLRPATDAVNLLLRMGTGGGPTYDTGANYYGTMRHGAGALAAAPGTPNGGSSNGTLTNADAAATSIMLVKTISNAAGGYGNASFSYKFVSPQSTAVMKFLHGTSVWHNGTEVFAVINSGLYASTTAVTALRFLMSSGNITSGTIRIYGIAK